ncbi:hypothetical protein VTI74DRAFT_2765 [Chaetomium olivicolor]
MEGMKNKCPAFSRGEKELSSYHIRNTIGFGSSGEVKVVRHKQDGQVYALKRLYKNEIMMRRHTARHIYAEQAVLLMAKTKKSEWIVSLRAAFQTRRDLYLCMEFLPGGDLTVRLQHEDVLTEEAARFYAAETVMAIESTHKLGVIHRDIKPDHILIDHDGHVKLADFGLAKLVPARLESGDEGGDHASAMLAPSSPEPDVAYLGYRIGTAGYMAPELMLGETYSFEVD